jgi:hypothetical protein
MLRFELADHWIIDATQARVSAAGGAEKGEEVVEGEHGSLHVDVKSLGILYANNGGFICHVA